MNERVEDALYEVKKRSKKAWDATSKHLPPRVAEGIRAPTKRLLRQLGLVSKP